MSQKKPLLLGELLFLYIVLSIVLFSSGYSFFNSTSNYIDINSDAAFYIFSIENGYPPALDDHRAGRILVPELASTFYIYSKGMVGSWDAAKFSFFVINALLLLIAVGFYHNIMRFYGYSNQIIQMSALIFVTSFGTTNYFLRGLVDSGEVLFLAVLTWGVLKNKLYVVPLVFIFGVLNRETFLALGLVLLFGDLIHNFFVDRKFSKQIILKLLALILSALCGAVTHVVIQYYVSGDLITPFTSFQKFDALPKWGENRFFVTELRRFLYVFLLPIFSIIFFRIKLPTRMVFHIFSLSAAIFFGSWVASTSGTGLSRYLFTGIGFYLSIYVATCLCNGAKKNV